jgi:hypothetical protein
MIISVEAKFPGGGIWKKIIATSCNNLVTQQGSWMVKTTIRNLKENKINTLIKYIKQYYSYNIA